MQLQPTQPQESPFERIKHIDENGQEYWLARELQPLLGYIKWQKFQDAIERAKLSCETRGEDSANHITGAGNELRDKYNRPRIQKDFKLTRFGCYMIAMNGDIRKIEIANAQAYFANSTIILDKVKKELEQPKMSRSMPFLTMEEYKEYIRQFNYIRVWWQQSLKAVKGLVAPECEVQAAAEHMERISGFNPINFLEKRNPRLLQDPYGCVALMSKKGYTSALHWLKAPWGWLRAVTIDEPEKEGYSKIWWPAKDTCHIYGGRVAKRWKHYVGKYCETKRLGILIGSDDCHFYDIDWDTLFIDRDGLLSLAEQVGYGRKYAVEMPEKIIQATFREIKKELGLTVEEFETIVDNHLSALEEFSNSLHYSSTVDQLSGSFQLEKKTPKAA